MFHRKWNFIFENIAGIPSSYQERWQAYLAPNKTDMASMFGSLLYQHDQYTFPIYSLKKSFNTLVYATSSGFTSRETNLLETFLLKKES